MLSCTNMYRIKQLYDQPVPLFHAKDLEVIWKIKNKNTLYKRIERYVKKGLLYRLHKGFYSTRPVEEIDPYLLGLKALRDFGYVSCETVLFEKGVIFQPPKSITLVSRRSLNFKIGGLNYKVRRLKDEFLFNFSGIEQVKTGVFVASLERAVADMLYYNPKYYFDNPKAINWIKVRSLQKKIGYVNTN